MEVLIPTAPVEFNFDSSTTTPYISAPSSPQRFGAFFFSAPTSPTKASAFYKDFSIEITDRYVSSSGVPFDWEVTPGTPKSMDRMSVATDEDEIEDSRDFAFDFSSHMETCSLTAADELFDGGKIKPLKPPPRLQFYEGKIPADSWSPKSPRSPKKLIKDALSPRHKKKDFDPFAAAHEQTCRESSPQGRGRERTNINTKNNSSSIRNTSSSRQKKTRSLSPYRVSDLLIDSQDQINQEGNANANANAKQNSLFPSSPSFSSFWYKKWNLKDLLLFRSASEGRASSSKDQMKKYAMLKRNQQEDLKNSSFRSTDSIGSTTSSSSSRRRGPVSAHERHYTTNRAVTEEMRKKTFLPYKRTLLGCMGFSSGMPIHEISKGLGSLHRAR